MMQPRFFCELSDSGSADGSTRSSCEPVGSLKFLESFAKGTPLLTPKSPPVVKIEPPVPLEDMPWSFMVPVVSEKLRVFLENAAPEHAQFFQVRLTGPKHLIPTQPYYLVNWLYSVDCIDFSRSEWEKMDNGKYRFIRTVIDASKIPECVLIFRAAHCMIRTFIDSDLANAMKESHLSGPQFYDIGYSYLDDI